jgi:hypothetical protein
MMANTDARAANNRLGTVHSLTNAAVALSHQLNLIDPFAMQFVVRFVGGCVVEPAEAV